VTLRRNDTPFPEETEDKQEESAMKKGMVVTGIAVVVAAAMVIALGIETAQAQGRGEGRRDRAGLQGPGGGRGQQGPQDGAGFDPEQMLDRVLQHHQKALDCSDEEWATLEPLVKKVLELRPRPGVGGIGRRPGGREGAQGGGRGMRGGPAIADPAAEALQAALDSTESTDADIEAKLQAVRDARKAKAAELKAARDALAAAAGTRTEARLVLMGTLE
jgi:hypothetical protein